MKFSETDKKYYSQFNLSRDPFPSVNNDKFLYLSPELNRRLEQLRSQVTKGEELSIVISPVGGGKSVIAEHFLTFKEPDWMVALVKGNSGHSPESLALELLGNIFPDTEFESHQAVSQIHKFLETAAINGKLPVFIIDDAHMLSYETLQFILQLADLRYNEACFRIVLFANESINDHLERQGLKELTEGLLFKINLPPFSKEQTRSYIEKRIGLGGENVGLPFTENEMQQIFRVSAGLPGGINILARQIMQMKTADSSHRPSNTGSPVVVIAIVVVVMLIISASYYFYVNNGTGPEEVADIDNSIPPNAPLSEVEQGQDVEETVIPSDDIEDRIFEAQVSLDISSTDTMEPGSEIETGEQGATPADGFAVPLQEDVTPAGQETVSEQEPEIMVLEPGEQTIIEPVSYRAAGTDNIYNLDFIPDHVGEIRGPDWLKQQPRELFVLQIMSARNFSNVESMLRKLSGPYDQFSGYTNYTPSGKPRYLLYYGLFPDRQSAYDAVDGLPQPLRNVAPWPRDIGSIVNQIQSLEERGYY